MRCDRELQDDLVSGALFQSLSGFLMRCDNAPIPAQYTLFSFQSLSGFLMRCDVGVFSLLVSVIKCFNPYRVF